MRQRHGILRVRVNPDVDEPDVWNDWEVFPARRLRDPSHPNPAPKLIEFALPGGSTMIIPADGKIRSPWAAVWQTRGESKRQKTDA